MPNPPTGKKHWRCRSFIFSDSDVALFFATLQSALPQLRIHREHEVLGQDRKESGPPPELQYRDKLASPENFTDLIQRVWPEPEGWAPAWSVDDQGRQILSNPPPLSFMWETSQLLTGSWLLENGHWRLSTGRVSALYTDGDKEQRTFISKVWRTIAQLSTNKTPWHYHDSVTGEILGPIVHSDIWIGHGALDWVRQDPRRCLFCRHRPSDSIEGLPNAGSSG